MDGDLEELDFGEGMLVASIGSCSSLTLRSNSADTTNLHRHARRNAQDAVAKALQKASEFDQGVAEDRKKQEAKAAAKGKATVPAPAPAPVDCQFFLFVLCEFLKG